MNLPLARTIVLTDAGTMAYSDELAAYDGTPAGTGSVTPAPTPVSITGTPPSTGTVGQPYSFTPTAMNGVGTKVFGLASGTLRPGLSLSVSTGAITGTPTAAGTMAGLSVRVTDDTGSASTTPTDVTIAAPAVTLSALMGSGALVSGAASSGTLSGLTAGSRVTTTVPGLTINRVASTYTFNGSAAAGSYTITEALAGATNSPRSTAVVVQPAGSTPDTWGGGGSWGGGGAWGGGGGGTTPTPASVAVSGLAMITEGTGTSTPATVTASGPATITEGNSSTVSVAATGPATITEGN